MDDILLFKPTKKSHKAKFVKSITEKWIIIINNNKQHIYMVPQ